MNLRDTGNQLSASALKDERSLSRSLPSDLFGYDSFPCTVYRGLMELRKVGIRTNRGKPLWKGSRLTPALPFLSPTSAGNTHCKLEISSSCSYQLAKKSFLIRFESYVSNYLVVGSVLPPFM
ncbi:hypothetical protein NC651_029837 [Populus alba x Populus x berolinensis]|nr:hypothetical protein NC651_029837 [Populus alba x Populus x berolinensis]